MSSFVPNKQHLREALLFCFNLKKNAAEARRLLEEAYGKHAPSKTTCEDWFKRFRSGDFEPCIARKTTRMGHETRTSDIAARHNAPCHRTSIVQDTIKTLKLDLLSHSPYSPDLAPSDYHLFRSMAHGLAGLPYTWPISKKCKIGWMNGFGPKTRRFIVVVFMYCQRDGKNV